MKKNILLFTLLYALCMFLSLNMNSKYRIFTYKSTMWADASGYYVYLPATFIYQWDVKNMPDGIDTLVGRGFSFQQNKTVLFSKYTSGIAFLQAPFFAIAHLCTKWSGGLADGFSQNYVNSLLFSGVFYLLLALFCLYYFLKAYFSQRTSLITCLTLVLCTNLYYYGIEHPGLSHVYSFFLICSSLLFIQRNAGRPEFWLPPVFALLILIRPTNIVAVSMLTLLHFNINRISLRKLHYPFLAAGCMAGFLIVLPQLYYWRTLSGSWIMYSYGNEGFTNWRHPYIKEVFFAATNGLFTWSPILLLYLAGFRFIPVSKFVTLVCLGGFILITYLNASWWVWPFGCAYGGRAFIEYFPFLGMGLAALTDQTRRMKPLLYITIFALALINIRLVYNFDDCFYGGTWDYHVILDLLLEWPF